MCGKQSYLDTCSGHTRADCEIRGGGEGGWRKEDNLCVVSSRIWTLAVDTHVCRL